MHIYKKTTLAVLLGLSAIPYTSIAAETNNSEAEEAVMMEEVIAVASPIRDSQKAAIDAKKYSNNFVDVVAADTIGRFPDQNLADSLGRVPGLAIERDQGQARYINFRGAPFRYTSIAIDGIIIPGAENGRIPRFDSFPSVVTSRIEANKAVTAKMPGESISGYININTFNPFDTAGFSVSADIGKGEQQLGGGDISKYGLRTSWSNDEWGFTLFGSSNSREQTTDNREYDLEIVDDQLQVNSLDFRSYKVKREDQAVGGRIEYRPGSAADRFFISTLKTKFQDHEQRNQYTIDFASGAEAMQMEQGLGETGSQSLVMINRMLQDGTYENSTFTTTLGSDLQLGDWFVEARINHTKTENDMLLPMPMSRAGMASASYDLTNIYDPKVSLTQMGTDQAITIGDVDNYAVNMALIYQSKLDITSDQIKIDAERNMNLFGLSSYVNLGFSMNDKEAEGFGASAGYGSFPESINIKEYLTNSGWETDFTNSIGGAYYNNAQLRKDWEAASGELSVTPSDDQKIVIEEKITTGYAMLTTEQTWGNWIVGLRAEQTDYTSQGSEASFSDDVIHWLPSAHLNINLEEDVKLRMSLTSAISRPTYNEWRGSATYDLTNTPVTVQGGNPALEAEEAWGGDIALEWYAGDASLFSAGAFTRSIDNVIYADSSFVDGGNYLPGAEGEQWEYTGYVNGDNGKLSGIELNAIVQLSDFATGWFDGFGFSANATFLDSEFETLTGNKFSLPGTSDSIFNASAFYENDSLSIRLNYQHRDAWLSTTENDSMGEYWDAQKRVDLSASYDLPLHWFDGRVSLYANINNLTDETDVRYVGTLRTPNQAERYGKRYLVGVRVNY
ncbi:TonB-dependent receptor [Catenovulum sp. 2E275]|uniref:TonB-dependent receptor n=1 Tax=Catenovulum sp. 2E275 TaxID=2980497 RepID=UPI0021D1B5B7|nr:TonB-dependent receptor [Catenovulum sp. 2E275]MCU4675122.1 TonB-dependent receptor [Catenovulum sp. 2E275]